MSRTINLDLEITKGQSKFLKSKKKGTIFHAGVGSGKSLILCRKGILNCLNKRKFCLISFSYRTLNDVLMDLIFDDLKRMGLKEGSSKDFVFNKNDMIINIFGQPMLLRSGDRPGSLRGLNVDDIGVDEGREFKTNELFNIAIARIRKKEDSQWFIASTTNGKDWVHTLSKDTEDVEYITQTTYENPFLPKSYIKDLEKRYTKEFVRQELNAEIMELGSGIIKSKWFRNIPYIKAVGGVRYWDLAVSISRNADYSCGARCTMGQTGIDRFCLHNMIHGKFEYPDLKKKIISAAHSDGKDCIIGVEEAGQQKGFIDDLKRTPELEGYIVRAVRPKGDKLNRAMPWAARAEGGNMDICDGHWNDEFTSECNGFTADDSHAHDDYIDATSGAYSMIAYSHKAVGRRMAI